jgi:DNA-binding MarR family transcriptional regulator
MQESTQDKEITLASLTDSAKEVLTRALSYSVPPLFSPKRIPKRYRLKPIRPMGRNPRVVGRVGHRHALRHKNRIPENVGAYKRRELLELLRRAARRGSVVATAILAELE